MSECGYEEGNLVEGFTSTGGRSAALAGFSQRPFDSRSACLLALDIEASPAEEAAAFRDTGAPVALLCWNDELLWWRQKPEESGEYLRVPAKAVPEFFREHKDDLAPRTIYRAKTLGRFESEVQRDFVDLGLMPMVEQKAGEIIENLLLDQVVELREAMGWPKNLSESQGRWLVKSIFWLLGAKMLHDKRVERFIRLDFGDVDQVFERVARHYGQSAEAIVTSIKKRKTLQRAAKVIASKADLRLASTEALAYVYERTLISREVRKGLGTHSTPTYLVDYVVGRLAPRIAAMSPGERSVFEPACGHAGFLVSAMRLLTSLLSPEESEPANRRSYLRQRIQGCDKDEFALEIARLSLTLSDIPNPNGWNLRQEDVFTSDLLEQSAGQARILLSNPPFEKIAPVDRETYSRKFRSPQFVSKAAEILHRSVAALPSGGVFGLVIPQNLLHSKDGTEFRKLLCRESEFEEICLFPDKVFNFADSEVAILTGQKTELRSDRKRAVRYRRVRDGEMDAFTQAYAVSSEITVPMTRFPESETCDLRVPDLEDVWAACAGLPTLDEFVDVGQGFSFIGEDQEAFPKGKTRTSRVKKSGFKKGFENLGKGVMSHQLPPTVYLNLSEEIILRPRLGTTTGVPQVILNEAPVQRAPWCVKAMVDLEGRAATTTMNLCRLRNKDGFLEVLWGLLSSPIANGFAFAHSSKWHILAGTWREFHVPRDFESLLFESKGPIVTAVRTYFEAVRSYEEEFALRSDDDQSAALEALKILHWRIDAEVLKLYKLPVELERKLLDYFAGKIRVGVPFHQDRYFPEGFDLPLSLADYLAITADWEETNTRRLKLIKRKQRGPLSKAAQTELKDLKRLARAKAALEMPLPNKELAEQEADLRRSGLWKGE